MLERLKSAPASGRTDTLPLVLLPGTLCDARLFAPDLGVGEDPATGSAAAGLVGRLAGPEGVHLVAITQGVEMGRPSLIIAGARKTGDGEVMATVAGQCGPVMRGGLEV